MVELDSADVADAILAGHGIDLERNGQHPGAVEGLSRQACDTTDRPDEPEMRPPRCSRRAGTRQEAQEAPEAQTKVTNAAGPVATVTRDVIAAAKATSWTTTETCEGTRVSVTEGVVKVLDRRRRKTKTVSAGSSTFVKRRSR